MKRMNNKLVIPTILAATILVAGMFALMPVQKATTVHTTILTATGTQFSDTVTDATTSPATRNVASTDGKKWEGTINVACTALVAAATAFTVAVNDGDGLQTIATGSNPGIGATSVIEIAVAGSDPTGTAAGQETWQITCTPGAGATVSIDAVLVGTRTA